MNTELKYGGGALSLEFSEGTRLVACLAPRGGSLAEPRNAVREALQSPFDLPPLSEAVLPSDVVAVAVEEGLPQAVEVVVGVVRAVLACGVKPEAISVLFTENDADLASVLCERIGESAVSMVVHEPRNRQQLAYLAVSHDDQPIYLNRRLCDADIVLPVALLRLDPTQKTPDVFGGFFPAFADEETQARLRREEPAPQARAGHAAEEAAELLGILFAMAIVPGECGGILRIMAGTGPAIQKQGQQIIEDAWTWEIPQRSALVVASLSGGSESQTWENFGRVLRAASEVVESGGAIVVCTELAEPPTEGLARLAEWEEAETLRHDLRQQQTAEANVAILLSETLEDYRVYLLSRLEPETVEALGMTPVQNAEEISRLSRGFETCTLLANAQYIFPKVMQP